MKNLFKAAPVLFVFLTSSLSAQSRLDAESVSRFTWGYEWDVFTGINSASLAHEGAQLLSSATFNFDVSAGGEAYRLAIVTFWMTPTGVIPEESIIRCIDFFDQFLQPTSALCAIPERARTD